MDWFESENFWTQFAPIMFDDARWAEAPTVAQYVKDIAKLRDGAAVLDAGCGLGRISVELAALDLDVTGVDIIQSELDAARESAEAEGVPLKLINHDLRTFHAPNQFDCAVNLYTSFGYCASVEEDMQILKNIADSVKPGGTFIMECTSRETAVMYWTPGEEFERAGYKVVTHFEVVGAWEGLKSQWTLYPADTDLSKSPASKPVVDHCFVQRLYPATFLRDKLIEFGFSDTKVYGDFDKSPYNEHARTMVLIGIKK
ncbi:Methyltransferase domain-containing protein [Treponema bryantii]|uniref:Methyltransferase domain-containing protein n=1 Tax=Treponema bryantii TaxID=163 RepID=A0A1H9FGU7_9SPIR|nr:class I SAM-dependent methyltransferase [Treponema bryantii]SEQ37156.1 Methyltransferase domain-containing protein [Treponema bryantii]